MKIAYEKKEITKFPCVILENILLFLINSYSDVSNLRLVCKNWHIELHPNYLSPNIWKTLIERKKWPLVRQVNCYTNSYYQRLYLHHHNVSNLLKAIESSVKALFHSSNDFHQGRTIIQNTCKSSHKELTNWACRSLLFWRKK